LKIHHKTQLLTKKQCSNVGENGGQRHHSNDVNNWRYPIGQAFFSAIGHLKETQEHNDLVQ